MIEALVDHYARGLDKRKDVVELHRKVKEELSRWTTRANNAKPGTPYATEAPIQRDLWAKAKLVFSTEGNRQKYDAELTAWQNSADAQRAKGQTDQLVKDFASATETVLELVARAWEELDKGNLHAASQVASKAMRVDASHWEAYLIAGIASFRQNDFDESMFCMRQAARLNPDNAQVFSGLGELYERQDNWQEAFKHYSKAIDLVPNDIDYKIRAGFVCVKAEAPDQGIELLRKALEIDPDHQGAKWALGLALADSAQLGWTEVLDGHPRVPPGWYAMSRDQALQAIRKLDEANALGVADEELSAHLAKVKQDVDRNVKRHFDGSWFLFGVVLLVAFFLKDNIGVSLLVAVLAAVYYGAHLPPQYSTNARILAGDSKLKTGFLDWLENIQNQWVKLTINLMLIALLPIFTIYWAIKNWTGDNAPLGDAFKSSKLPSEVDSKNTSPLAKKEVAVQLKPTPITQKASVKISDSKILAKSNIFDGSNSKIIIGAVVIIIAISAFSGWKYWSVKSNTEFNKQTSLANDFLRQNPKMSQKWLQNHAVVSDFAIQSWGDENTGGMAILKHNPTSGWMQIRSSGGAFDARNLVELGVPTSIAEKLLIELEKGTLSQSVATSKPSGNAKIDSATQLQQSPTPIQNESAAAPMVKVGDIYTYETLDQLEPKLNNVTTREIVDVNSNGFTMKFVNAKSKYARQLTYDRNLNLASSRSGENDGMNYSPALQYFKFPMKSGDSWTSTATEINIKTGKTRTHTLSGIVGGLEQVTVPSGTFKAFRITIQSELNDSGQISTGQDTSWYSPDVRRTVKSELESRDSTGKVGRRTVNLISYRLQ